MIKITNGCLTAEINEKGAQLSRLASKTTEYLWYGNPEIWPKHAPVLFPFAGRLKDQKFSFEGKEYGPMTLHGFAPYVDYVACDKTEDSVRMKMIVTEEIKAIWPFDFEFAVFFKLEGKTLFVTYEVKNNGNKTMYYGMGSHPGFNVPMEEGIAFEDYYIDFPDSSNVYRNVMTDDTCLDDGVKQPYPLDGTKLHLKHNLFDSDAVILSNTGNKAVIKSDRGTKSVTVEYPDTRYCAVWHKVKMEVPFVCIEPWTSLPGSASKITALEEKEDYNVLEGGKTKIHHLNITVTE